MTTETETFLTHTYVVRWMGCVLSEHHTREAAERAATRARRIGLFSAYVDRILEPLEYGD